MPNGEAGRPKRGLAGEKGAVMVMAATYVTLLLLVAGAVLDFGRAHLYRALLQSAVDAGALAGALEVIPMVELSVPRWEYDEYDCWDAVQRRWETCSRWVRIEPATIAGPERQLLIEGRWWQQVQPYCRWPLRCDRRYLIIREWIILPPSAADAAREGFARNARWPAGAYGATLENLTVRTDPVRAEVSASATLTTPTVFLKLIGVDQLRLTRSGTARPVRR
jgi:hypothetical protein